MKESVFDELREKGGLALHTLARVEYRFAEALRHKTNWRVNLRHAVREVVKEVTAVGASRETARRLISHTLDNHPERHELDRSSVINGECEADRIAREVMAWFDSDALDSAAARRGRDA